MARIHVVKQGEYLSLIAARYGFAWKKIYDHPSNAALKKKRPDPNVLLPGDEVAIPDRDPATPMASETGKKVAIVVTRPRDELVLELRTAGGGALAGQSCQVELTDAKGISLTREPLQTRTSGNGELRQSLPPGAARALVTVLCQPPLRWSVAIGQLDPVRDMSKPFDAATCHVKGVQARLNNMGFPCGEVDGRLGPRTRGAIASFQRRVLRRNTADGTLDQETCDRLVSEHGS